MVKPEWGVKRTCFSCNGRFYDLKRDPIICPICNTVIDPARQPKPKRTPSSLRDEPVLAPEVVDDEVEAGADDDALEDAGDGDLEDLDETGAGGSDAIANEEGEIIEDASELGEDDDDIGEVMEHVDDEIDEKP